MTNSKVSIIMPLFNSKAYIKDAINSVLEQTYQDWELLITDDCSTDGSYEYVLNLINENPKIKLFKLAKNSGTAVARNNSLKNASGRYITFLDSDDLLDKNYLESQIHFLNTNKCAAVSACYRRMADNSNTIFRVSKVNTYKSILKGNDLSCLTTLYDKEIIGDVFFPEDMLKCEDYVFWLRILKTGVNVYGNGEILATYRILGNSKSRNKIKLINYMYQVYRKKEKFNFLRSWFYVFRWAIYGIKKYRGVK